MNMCGKIKQQNPCERELMVGDLVDFDVAHSRGTCDWFVHEYAPELEDNIKFFNGTIYNKFYRGEIICIKSREKSCLVKIIETNKFVLVPRKSLRYVIANPKTYTKNEALKIRIDGHVMANEKWTDEVKKKTNCIALIEYKFCYYHIEEKSWCQLWDSSLAVDGYEDGWYSVRGELP